MEYYLQRMPLKKSRFTIGFLDENVRTEYSSRLIDGIFEAARKYDINVIRFAYYSSHVAYEFSSQVNMVLDHIEQYNLDGLMFLGWTRAAAHNNYEDFFRRFHSIPLLSIGMGFDNIPFVYFPGDYYFKNLLVHLIEVHQCKRIAFVSPIRSDSRNRVYTDTLNEYGLYRPELIVHEDEIVNLDLYIRAKRALEILLDKRKEKFDVIISLYTEESAGILLDLNRRGISVPAEIAVASYEDGEVGQFSSPGLTSIYFPYRELGYSACEKMAELLRKGKISQATEVPGRIIYRNSCGCMPHSVNLSRTDKIILDRKEFSSITEDEIKRIVDEVNKKLPSIEIDVSVLLKALINNYKNQTGSIFLSELEVQLRKIKYNYHNSGVENIISILRILILPYFIGQCDEQVWVESIFQQAQILVRERMICLRGQEDVSTKDLNVALQEISQILSANFNMQSIMNSLEENLWRLNIKTCYIFIFNSDNQGESIFDNCSLEFEFCDNVRINNPASMTRAKQLLSERLFSKERSYTMLANLLHVTDEFIGFILFEPGPKDTRVYQTLTINISNALRSAILLDKLDSSYKKLVEQAHREGMANIATGILHNVGNILNSVNVSISLMKDIAVNSPVDDLLKANNLLEKNIENIEDFILHDPKGKKLMQFYLRLGEPFTELQNQMQYHIGRLDEKINSINEIICAQQNYAGIKPVMEELDIASIVEDAISLYASSLDKYKIKVIKCFEDIPKTLVQRTKLFHILVNLIKNAKESLEEMSGDDRRIVITIYQDAEGKYIQINDNGCGISEKNIESIFAYGYTTKKEGHGFGLHSCANYMTEMGGKIWAESEGHGKGATFVLQFK